MHILLMNYCALLVQGYLYSLSASTLSKQWESVRLLYSLILILVAQYPSNQIIQPCENIPSQQGEWADSLICLIIVAN